MAFVSTTPIRAAGSFSTARSSVCAAKVSSFRGHGFAVVAPRRAIIVSMSLETIQTQIQEEMKKAQEATAKFGKESKEAATAWDIVEELEAKASDMKQPKPDPLEEFCEDVPEADECRTYDS